LDPNKKCGFGRTRVQNNQRFSDVRIAPRRELDRGEFNQGLGAIVGRGCLCVLIFQFCLQSFDRICGHLGSRLANGARRQSHKMLAVLDGDHLIVGDEIQVLTLSSGKIIVEWHAAFLLDLAAANLVRVKLQLALVISSEFQEEL
jgi:hypothetical protein